MPDSLKHQLGQINQHYIWASFLWGTIASGYLIYGWKQKSVFPFVGSLIMLVVSIFVFSALEMSLICIAIMAAIYWLTKNY